MKDRCKARLSGRDGEDGFEISAEGATPLFPLWATGNCNSLKSCSRELAFTRPLPLLET